MANQIKTMDKSRRRFLWGLAGGGFLLAASGGQLLLNHKADGKLAQVRQTRNMMGTYVQITAYTPSRDQALTALDGAFREISRLETIFTRFDSASCVGELNRRGRLKEIPLELWEVLIAAQQVHLASGGIFDPTVLPLLNALEQEVRNGRQPDAYNLAQARELVGCSKISLSGDQVAFLREGMAITLDGIAKGYIVDKAAQHLTEAGIEHALVNAGGDIRVLGRKPSGPGWEIAVQDPADPQKYLTRFNLTEGAVATSGNYQIYFDEEKRYGHLLNPLAAEKSLPSASVTILAPTCQAADAFASAVFAAGPQRGLSLVREQAGFGALLVDRQGARQTWRFNA